MLISKLTLTSEGTPICRHFKKSPQKKCRARKKIQSKRTLTDIRSAIFKKFLSFLSTSRSLFFFSRTFPFTIGLDWDPGRNPDRPRANDADVFRLHPSVVRIRSFRVDSRIDWFRIGAV